MARPPTALLERLRLELAGRQFEQPRVPGNLVLALVEECLASRAREAELDADVAEIVDDAPPERRPTPARPLRRTTGPWARGAELRPEEPEELDLTLPGD